MMEVDCGVLMDTIASNAQLFLTTLVTCLVPYGTCWNPTCSLLLSSLKFLFLFLLLLQAAIDRYSARDSQTFVFLLSTRAGGLGITLTAVRTEIFFSSTRNHQFVLKVAYYYLTNILKHMKISYLSKGGYIHLL